MLGILSVAILMVGYLSEHCPERKRERERRRVTESAWHGVAAASMNGKYF